jgi:integrase
MAQKIVKRWADYSRLGDLSPHDLRRTAITRALDAGLTHRQVQMMWEHKDPLTKLFYTGPSPNPHVLRVSNF